MRGAIAIFVKTAGYSVVKSRLSAGCGERYALDWYARAAEAVASVARRVHERHGTTVYWAVAEHTALDAWTGLPVIAQGDGDLGTRMAHVHAQLVERHGFALLIGADAPQLTGELLAEAVDWLMAPSPRLALGPASDGGFWLFGANVAPVLSMWTSVRYSDASTATALRQSMQGVGEWRSLTPLTDADHAHDLVHVQNALQSLPDPTPQQSALAGWMREHNTARAGHGLVRGSR